MDFEEIYKRYFHDVYLFILAMSGNPHTAEEITQETFFRAMKNIHKFQGNCSVKTWLCQIGKNIYLSWLKQQKRFADTKINNPSDDFPSSAGANSEDAETICIRKDETLSIYKIIHCLDEPYKEVFILRTLSDLTFREIGEIFGRGEGWARVTFYRAKQKIQEYLKEV